MPTFIIFKNGNVVESIRGANPPALNAAVQKIVGELAQETAKAKPAEPTENKAHHGSEGSGEDKTVSGSYSMTSGTSWRMAL